MGVFHRATITPSKADMVASWVTTRPWGPSTEAGAGQDAEVDVDVDVDAEVEVEVVGAFRFDDPENQVGIETHLVRADGTLFQVPLTYRNEPVSGAEDSLVGPMEHSELGTRWVYDGLGDDLYITMLAAVSMTGQGEALGMANYEGRWYIAPANVRIHGGGWSLERVPVDGFEQRSANDDAVVFGNDHLDLTFFRRPIAGPRPAIGMTATWDGQTDPVVMAEISRR